MKKLQKLVAHIFFCFYMATVWYTRTIAPKWIRRGGMGILKVLLQRKLRTLGLLTRGSEGHWNNEPCVLQTCVTLRADGRVVEN